LFIVLFFDQFKSTRLTLLNYAKILQRPDSLDHNKHLLKGIWSRGEIAQDMVNIFCTHQSNLFVKRICLLRQELFQIKSGN